MSELVNSPAFPFIYQYGIGGAIFALGIYFFLKSRSISLKSSEGIKMLLILIGGYLFFFCFHFFFQFIAPYLGGAH